MVFQLQFFHHYIPVIFVRFSHSQFPQSPYTCGICVFFFTPGFPSLYTWGICVVFQLQFFHHYIPVIFVRFSHSQFPQSPYTCGICVFFFTPGFPSLYTWGICVVFQLQFFHRFNKPVAFGCFPLLVSPITVYLCYLCCFPLPIFPSLYTYGFCVVFSL